MATLHPLGQTEISLAINPKEQPHRVSKRRPCKLYQRWPKKMGPHSPSKNRPEKVKANSRPSLFPACFPHAKTAPKTGPLFELTTWIGPPHRALWPQPCEKKKHSLPKKNILAIAMLHHARRPPAALRPRIRHHTRQNLLHLRWHSMIIPQNCAPTTSGNNPLKQHDTMNHYDITF